MLLMTRDLTRAIHQQITLLALNVQDIRLRYGPAIDQIRHESDALDGYPSIASGADTGRPSHSEDSIVLRTVQARTARNRTDTRAVGPTAKLDELLDLMQATNHAASLVIKELNRHAAHLTRSDIDRLRCIGTGGPDGATCTQIRAPRRDENGTLRDDGRCIDCGRTHDTEERRKREESDARRVRRHRKDVTA